MVKPGQPALRPLRSVVAGIGKAAAWLTLLMCLLIFLIVGMRYGFNLGWVGLQESVTYLHACVFMLAAAWTLAEDGHVRVDIFYREAGPRRQALINLLGTLIFLVPLCLYLLIVGWDYVAASWRLGEGSREAGGLPLVYLLKSLILALPILLLAQAVCGLVEDWRTFRAG